MGIFNGNTSDKTNTDSLKSESTPLLGGAGGGLDSTALYHHHFDKAEEHITKKLYDSALQQLDSALVYQPNDSKALERKEAIQKEEQQQSEAEKLAAEQAAYDTFIQKADEKYDQKQWATAQSYYQDALDLQSDAQHPKNRLKEIKRKLNKITANNTAEENQRKKKEQYNQLITDAGKAYDNEQYTTAKSKYQEALQINPSEKSYLQGKITAIDKILNPPPKPKPEPKQETKISSNLHPEIQTLLNSMVYVQGGTFKMGNENGHDYEKPIHSVTLSSYHIGKYEVTQAQWRVVMGSDPPELRFKGCSQCPVERVSWNDIQDFLKKLNQLTRKNFRLPTEAEWEYAARGGNKSQGYKYAGSNTIGDITWYKENSDRKTHPVGKKKANELGLYDISGNVYEWCNDWYGENYYSSSPSNNPFGPSSGISHVVRGGSWLNDDGYCRSSYRFKFNPSVRSDLVGFRLAK